MLGSTNLVAYFEPYLMFLTYNDSMYGLDMFRELNKLTRTFEAINSPALQLMRKNRELFGLNLPTVLDTQSNLKKLLGAMPRPIADYRDSFPSLRNYQSILSSNPTWQELTMSNRFTKIPDFSSINPAWQALKMPTFNPMLDFSYLSMPSRLNIPSFESISTIGKALLHQTKRPCTKVHGFQMDLKSHSIL
jgi:hypothetical protein